MIHLRPMIVDDIPEALLLWQDLPGIGLRGADSPPALARYLARNPNCSFVAITQDGELAGVSLAGHDGRRGYLHHVAVKRAYQKQGVARQLVDACLTALRRESIEKVHLWVKVDNLSGKSFWNHLGWGERSDIALMSIVTGDNPNA
jgi:ribosomal protein S18 acetylase RimI-like enzyme